MNHRLPRAWTLPVTVHPKVVIEATFATRDLLRALRRTPPHVVVRVDACVARVRDGHPAPLVLAGDATLVGEQWFGRSDPGPAPSRDLPAGPDADEGRSHGRDVLRAGGGRFRRAVHLGVP